VNSAITFNKKEKKRSETLVGDLDEQTADNSHAREEKIALETRIDKLHEAIGTLPEYERIIIGLVLEDLSYKEISNILGLSTNLIGVKINRIKKKLSTILNEPS
jgi:RNA polymerase sigma-70 factor (ECF subfamily)